MLVRIEVVVVMENDRDMIELDIRELAGFSVRVEKKPT